MNMTDYKVPPDVISKMLTWRKWNLFWSWIHYGLGFVGTVLSLVVAANTKQPFLSAGIGLTAASVAAGLTFLITAFSASAKSAAFETAARELEKAIALFKGGAEKRILFEAEARGVDILNKLK